MILTIEDILKYVDWSRVKSDSVVINFDGYSLKKDIYEELEYKVIEDTGCVKVGNPDVYAVFFPDKLHNLEYCKREATELMNKLNEDIKKTLELD